MNKAERAIYMKAYNAEYRKAPGFKAKKNAIARAWHKKNPNAKRASVLKCQYGLTLKDYDLMFEAQQGLCAICGRVETSRNQWGLKALAVDHDHKTGKVRGLLCSHCNTKLGHLEDLEFITKARIYLNE